MARPRKVVTEVAPEDESTDNPETSVEYDRPDSIDLPSLAQKVDQLSSLVEQLVNIQIASATEKAVEATTEPVWAEPEYAPPAKQPARNRPQKKRALTVRNLRNCPVHFRLFSQNHKDPYRIVLNPRGQEGDTHRVPAALIDDSTFVKGYNVLYEVIPDQEAREIDYYDYNRPTHEVAPLVRDEDRNLVTVPDWDGQGRITPRQRTQQPIPTQGRRGDGVLQNFVEMPGGVPGPGQGQTPGIPPRGLSPAQIDAMNRAGMKAMPPEVDLERRAPVRFERTNADAFRGQ